jgi:AraC-like DNA-binding protein
MENPGKIKRLIGTWIFVAILVYPTFGNYKIAANDTILIPYCSKTISIDGILDDWKNYYQTTFSDTCHQVNTAGSYSLSDVYPIGFNENLIPHPLSKNRVDVKMCWNQTHLFIGFHVMDRHLIAEFSAIADENKLHLNDAIELYIDAGNDSQNTMDINDYQFIVDILNQSVVYRGNLRLAEEEGMFVPKEKGQNVMFTSTVTHQGQINNPAIVDQEFTVEMMIPFAAIGIEPFAGKKMKIDICNDDADRLLKELGISADELFLTWPFNWTGIGDFGFPSSWKTVELTGKPPVLQTLTVKYGFHLLFVSLVILALAFAMMGISWHKNQKLKNVSKKIVVQNLVVVDKSLEREVSPDARKALLDSASQYIINSPSAHISPQQIADAINISLRTLQRLTKDELNCTPTVFINAIRLELASEFLRNKKGNISEAAYEFGFSDPAYFSRLFKKHYGISPRDFIAKQKI